MNKRKELPIKIVMQLLSYHVRFHEQIIDQILTLGAMTGVKEMKASPEKNEKQTEV